MPRKVRTPDCKSVGYQTDERPIWAQGKSFYDSYAFVQLVNDRIVAYTSAEYLTPLDDPKETEVVVDKYVIYRRFYQIKKLQSPQRGA